jgi:carbamate kinase
MLGVEAVVDKYLCNSLLARELEVECLIITTDVEAVYLDWRLPSQHVMKNIAPQALDKYTFPIGSMATKVESAIGFTQAMGRKAVIGSLDKIEDMLTGRAGTQVSIK